MNERRLFVVGLIAILFAVVAYSLAQTAQDTANINNIFEVVVNNTDLGTNGTNERIHNVTYWTNTSPIAVYLIFHVIGTGASFGVDSNVSINNTVVLDKNYRTDAGAGVHDHFAYSFIVPKNSNYTIRNSTSISSVEWREYPILAGKNGTLSINQTTINQGILSNASIQINESQVTNLPTDLNAKVNKSGDNMTGVLFSHGVGSYSALNDTTISYTFFSNNRYYTGTGWASLFSSRTGSTFQLENNALIFYTFAASSNTPKKSFQIVDLDDTKTTALCMDSSENIYRSTNATSNYLTC